MEVPETIAIRASDRAHRQRLAERAIARQMPFDVAEAARLLGISHSSVSVVLTRLLRDRVIEREGPGIYRAT